MKLEQKLNQRKNEIGLVGGPLKFLEVTNAETAISACIYPNDWHQEITVRKGWDPVDDDLEKEYVKKKNIVNSLEKVCDNMVVHEAGHWELPYLSGLGCPFNTVFHDKIKDRIAQALKKKGLNINLTDYVSNAFEDLLVNINALKFLKEQNDDFSGQILFWNQQGKETKEQKFTPFYEAFVKLNMCVFGDIKDHGLLKRYYNNTKEILNARRNIARNLGINRNIDLNVRKLYQKEKWPKMAYHFALEMAPLLEDQIPSEDLFGASTPAPGKEQGNKKKGSVFDKKLDKSSEKEKVVFRRYKAGDKCSAYMKSFEYLDLVYKSLARQIRIETESFTESAQLPIASFGFQIFDSELHNPKKIKFSKTSVDEDGNFIYKVPRGDILMTTGYKRNVKGFPKLNIINLDTSESMRKQLPAKGSTIVMNPEADEEYQWNNKSKYHFELCGLWGVFEFFELQGINTDYRIINISSETIVESGSIAQIKKQALTPQFGGTHLDINTFENATSDDSFTLSLSDGEIFNWSSIKDRYIASVKDKPYAHIQFGSSNRFTRDLENEGLQVKFVKKGEDLAELMIKITSQAYKGFAKDKIQNTPRYLL